MSSYAVLWSEEGCDVLAGKLELADSGLSFGGRHRHDVPYADIDSVHVARRAADRVRGAATLVLELAGGSVLRIASVGGAGIVSELGEQVAARSRARR
jgi:PH (Pleckstrin Homology) domain-containing protein